MHLLRLSMLAPLLAVVVGAVGCNVGGGNGAPGAPTIERAQGPVPNDLAQEPWVRQFWPAGPPRLIGRLKLRDGTYLFLTDWSEQPRCRLLYVARADGTGRTYGRTTCGVLPLGDRATDRIIDLYADAPNDGVSPRITTGTVDASMEEMRIHFTDCGSRTYQLDGPLVPSKPTRRIFLLDMGDCSWGKLEAIREGQVAASFEAFPSAG
jgi:hypothetical protein